LGIPRRVTTILEGESLVNDATGLIAYRYAVAAVVSGAFSFWSAGLQFFVVAAGGILLGLLMGFIFKWIHKITPNNPTTDTTLTFLTPFISYLVAESLHISGVLAVVAAGLYLTGILRLFFATNPASGNGTEHGDLYPQRNDLYSYRLQLPYILERIESHSFLTLLSYGPR
jgi:CPA1 family monovalent cation:H+ antiporter